MAKDAHKKIAAGLEEAIAWAGGEDTGAVIREIEAVDVVAIRKNLKLTQAEFCKRFHIAPGTLKNWEQHRRHPEGPAKALMYFIQQEPEAAMRAFAAG